MIGKVYQKKVEKTFKTMDNENIFSDINNLYKNYNEKEKIYKLYENKKGFFDKNIREKYNKYLKVGSLFLLVLLVLSNVK